jgi:hypothetical protein
LIFDQSYVGLSMVLSSALIVLTALYTRHKGHEYQVFHDERAAMALMLSVAMSVMALGLMVSSIGTLVFSPDLVAAGQSLVRGTLLTAMLVLVLSEVASPRTK